jgi:hypothetical protein
MFFGVFYLKADHINFLKFSLKKLLTSSFKIQLKMFKFLKIKDGHPLQKNGKKKVLQTSIEKYFLAHLFLLLRKLS